MKKFTKRLVSLALGSVVCLSLCAPTFAEEQQVQNSDTPTVPMVMQPNTIVVYDDDLEPHFIQGGYADAEDTERASTRSVDEIPYPHIVPIPEDASESEKEQIRVENEGAIAIYEALISGNVSRAPDPEICAGMKVDYGPDGVINNIYYRNPDEPSGYSLHDPNYTPPKQERVTVTGKNYKSWGDNYTNTLNYQPNDGSFLGTGRATYFVGKYGNRNNLLKKYDCATHIDYDYSKKGDQEVKIRNLDTDEVFTYHQADVGSLPDAIIDIWGEENIRELAGTKSGQPTSNANNVRYYHKLFSDQTAPNWK